MAAAGAARAVSRCWASSRRTCSHRDFQRLLEAGARWQWRPTVDLVETLRERKDAERARADRAPANGIATRALERTLPQVRVGMTELEVAGVLEKALRDAGSEGFPFPSIVASGPRSALPHARSSARRIERGDFLLLDFGAEYDGYCSDVTRTLVVGTAADEQREVYDMVREANESASRSGVRAGMTGRDADALARDYIEQRGFGDAVRAQPRPRPRAGGARSAAAGEDGRGALGRRRGGDDRAGDLSSGLGRGADRGRCLPRPRTARRSSRSSRAS